jgi:hypothetical protein
MVSKRDIGKAFVEHLDFSNKTREKLAEKGQAMPGGGFPIRNEADLKRAIQAYGRAKDKEAAKAWIIKRAKALGAIELLPDDWKEEAGIKQSSWLDPILSHHGVKGMKWGVRRSRRQLAKAAQSRTGKSVKDLSDEELRTVVNRMQMEQQYSRLTGGGSRRGVVAIGAAFAGSVLANVARTQLTNAANAQVSKALNRRK